MRERERRGGERETEREKWVLLSIHFTAIQSESK